MAITWHFDVQGTPLVVHGIYRDAKPKLASKLVADGYHVSFVNAGKFYSSRAAHSSRHYGRRWQSHIALIREAIALGVLPKSNLLRVAKIEEARRLRHNQTYAAKDAIRSAESAGVKLPPATFRALQRRARSRKS